MSLTFQQLILDAKKLVFRTSDQENLVNNLISEVQSVCSQMDSMKQYQDEVECLNAEAKQKPHSQLITGIEHENRQFREIQAENKELKMVLADHQNALELIMSKYRQQTAVLLRQCKIDFPSLYNSKYAKVITSQAEKINEMAAVMKAASVSDEEKELKDIEYFSQLVLENQILREVLKSGNTSGTLCENSPVEDKTVQTT